MNIAKSLSFIAYSLFLILAIYFYDQPNLHSYLYVSVCLFALIYNWKIPNTASLITLLLIVKVIELTIYPLLPLNVYIPQAFYLLLDLSVTIVIALRPAFCRYIELKVTGVCETQKYSITNADMLVGVIYFLYLFVSLLMIGEHLLRHLDHIGLEYSAWLNEHARVIWNNHINIKMPLNILEFVAIITTTKAYMRTRYKRF